MNYKVTFTLIFFFLLSYILNKIGVNHRKKKLLNNVNKDNSLTFDKAKYHLIDNEKINECEDDAWAYIHIGFYMSWLIKNDLIIDTYEMNLPQYKNNLISKIGTPIDFCFDMDGVLSAEILSNEAFLFTQEFYDETYIDVFTDEFFDAEKVENSWLNFEKIETVLNKKFKRWQKLTYSIN